MRVSGLGFSGKWVAHYKRKHSKIYEIDSQTCTVMNIRLSRLGMMHCRHQEQLVSNGARIRQQSAVLLQLPGVAGRISTSLTVAEVCYSSPLAMRDASVVCGFLANYFATL